MLISSTSTHPWLVGMRKHNMASLCPIPVGVSVLVGQAVSLGGMRREHTLEARCSQVVDRDGHHSPHACSLKSEVVGIDTARRKRLGCSNRAAHDPMNKLQCRFSALRSCICGRTRDCFRQCPKNTCSEIRLDKTPQRPCASSFVFGRAAKKRLRVQKKVGTVRQSLICATAPGSSAAFSGHAVDL